MDENLEKKKKLEELAEKIDKVREGHQVEITPDDWKKLAPSFARPAMRGTIGAVLKLDEEARNMIFREIGEACSESFLETSEETWETDGLSQVAKAVMAGAFRGILKLDEEAKKLVFKEQAEHCFRHHLSFLSSWEAAGISLAPGSYDIDSAVVVLEKMLKLRTVRRYEDTIFWEGQVGRRYGKCSCSLVWSGILDEPVPELCQCASSYMKYQFEYLTGQPVESELVESLNCGSQECCKFRVHLKPTRITVR